jgi:HlyD family secretion protein
MLTIILILKGRRGADVRVATAEVTHGVVARSLMSTGTFEPANAVDVGSEVSGTISAIDSDFNSRVRTGQIIARLDSAAANADLTKAKAALAQARANAARLRAIADDARVKLARAEALAAQDLISAADLETAQVVLRQAETEWKGEEAASQSARAALRQARVNRAHTIIRSPIDGVVVHRHVRGWPRMTADDDFAADGRR